MSWSYIAVIPVSDQFLESVKMERFCLRWSDFETNVRESFRQLWENKNNCDVTIATDDGYHIQAHKVVLSTGSKFFSNIFMKTIHPSPFIYLKGVKGVDLEYIVDFLYNGEALIAQEELENFLETAHELQVKVSRVLFRMVLNTFIE